MTILYMANDGVPFTTESECLDYEYKMELQQGKDLIIGRTYDGAIVDYEQNDFLDVVQFITCKNSEAVKHLHKRSEMEDIALINISIPGTYYWDTCKDMWILVSNRLEQLEKEVSLLKMIMEDKN